MTPKPCAEFQFALAARSEPDARLLVLNLELCTLHLRDAHQLEVFADGCAAYSD